MNITDEIRAKHVFGELTLGEVWQMVTETTHPSHIILSKEGPWPADHEYSSFSLEFSLALFADDNNMEPDWDFPLDTKVKVKEDHVEFADQDGCKIELSFARLEPIRFEIL